MHCTLNKLFCCSVIYLSVYFPLLARTFTPEVANSRNIFAFPARKLMCMVDYPKIAEKSDDKSVVDITIPKVVRVGAREFVISSEVDDYFRWMNIKSDGGESIGWLRYQKCVSSEYAVFEAFCCLSSGRSLDFRALAKGVKVESMANGVFKFRFGGSVGIVNGRHCLCVDGLNADDSQVLADKLVETWLKHPEERKE